MSRMRLAGAAILLLLVVSLVSALNLDTVAGAWSNLTGPGAPGTFLTVGIETQVRWGNPVPGGAQSGLGFTANAALPIVDLLPGEEFEIGTLRHFNNPIFLGSEADGVDLMIDLGFSDPVLSTFLGRSESDLATLLFHELAHEKVYVKGDTVFNESYATTVALAGLERFLDGGAAGEVLERERARQSRQEEFATLVAECRVDLQAIYDDETFSDADMRARKAQAFDDLRVAYRSLKESWGNSAGYDRWFAQDLNNAHLASVGTYSSWVPGFQRLLDDLGGDLTAFHQAVADLGRLDPDRRRERLEGM